MVIFHSHLTRGYMIFSAHDFPSLNGATFLSQAAQVDSLDSLMQERAVLSLVSPCFTQDTMFHVWKFMEFQGIYMGKCSVHRLLDVPMLEALNINCSVMKPWGPCENINVAGICGSSSPTSQQYLMICYGIYFLPPFMLMFRPDFCGTPPKRML